MKDIMENEVHVPVLFVWIELKISYHDVVDDCEDEESLLIAHELFHGEHIPAVFSSKTCESSSRKAFAVYIFVNLSLEFYHVQELEGGEEEADQQKSIV